MGRLLRFFGPLST